MFAGCASLYTNYLSLLGQVAEWSKAISLKLIIPHRYREFESLLVWQDLIIHQSGKLDILLLPLYLAMTKPIILIASIRYPFCLFLRKSKDLDHLYL
jgi:hypothetical protein